MHPQDRPDRRPPERARLGRAVRPALRALAALGLLVAAAGCLPPPPPLACGAIGSAPAVPVMGCARLSADQLAAWFEVQARPEYRATVPIRELVHYFVGEGTDEGVRGDLAFAQSIVETGWFNFPDAGSVRPTDNNFAGIGATGVAAPAQFPDAQTGVRAQMQHLRAYADPTVTEANLAHPLVDPRFSLVSPKGKAPLWNQFGNGTWASSPTYSTTVLNMYSRILAYYGQSLG
jgi:hypothetical protein